MAKTPRARTEEYPAFAKKLFISNLPFNVLNTPVASTMPGTFIVRSRLETVCGICHNDQKKIGAWSAVFLPVPGKIMSIAAEILPDPTNHYRGRGSPAG